MKKVFYLLFLIMLPRIADATDYACRITNFFEAECPTARDFGWSNTANNPKCICNSAIPPLCTITDIYDGHCPRNYYGSEEIQCNCVSGQKGNVNPNTGGRPETGSGGGGGGGGCDEPLPCTACYDTGWESNGTGYQVKKTGGTCVDNSCTSYGKCIDQTIEYRCAPGYCGTSTDGKTGCIKTTIPTGCRVLDTFQFECPADVENCLCTNSIPKICRALDIFDTPPSWATNYICGYNVWTANGTGYEQQIETTTENETCISVNKTYRCAAGYYGTTTNGTSGCTKCPTPGTSNTGTNTSMTQCYIPADTEMSDSSGTYIYTKNCYYSN